MSDLLVFWNIVCGTFDRQNVERMSVWCRAQAKSCSFVATKLSCTSTAPDRSSTDRNFCAVPLYCIVLYCIVLYCIVLYYIVLYCIILYYIILYYIILYYIILYYIILYYIIYIISYIILYYIIGPPSYTRFVVDRNVVMRRIAVYT